MNSQTQNSNRKIDEALELFNDAAREKKEESSRILNDKYSDLKETLLSSVRTQTEAFDKARQTLEETFQGSEESVRETVALLDKEVRKNPWPYLGGAAAAALLVGFILGNSKR